MEVTTARKGSDDYLVDWCDYVIGDLVKEKESLFKAYNYFNGVRDHYQYENLEKNYGIGNPLSVGFTPLTRKHIEALVGEYLTMKPKPRISCKDRQTLSNIFRDKQLEIASKQKQYLSQYLNNAIYAAIMGQEQQQDKQQADQEIDRELKGIADDVNRNFLSNYEIAAQDIVQYILQNRDIDFINKLEQLLLDLLISGQAYYKVVPTHEGTNFKIELCDPLNTWIDKDPKSRYMKHGYKAVVRKWMTAEEIEIKYGDYLSPKDLKEIRNYKNYDEDDDNYMLVTGQSARCGGSMNPGIWNDTGIHPLEGSEDDYTYKWDLIPVYEVEWIDSVKINGKWIGNCYQVVRIGADIYILDGENAAMQRNVDAPNEPRLSVNGIWYTNGHGAPYSLMLATADLQDNYDMLLYKKDNLIALSGTSGAIVDVASLPEFLGDDLEERLIKYQAYRKVGLAIVDTSQEGQQQINTIYNGFNDTQGLQAIQFIQLAIQQIEDTVSSITGVFRERLGGIQARDAVANVEAGMQQSYIITKRYYNAMDTLVKEIISDSIDMAKIVYKEGLTGQLILGNKREIFTVLPQYYQYTSYCVDLDDSAEIIKEQELLKQMAMQLAGSNMVDPEMLVIISTSKSLTEMKEMILQSVREKKIENNQLQQLQQALQQAQQQQQELQKQLEQSTQKLSQLNEQKMANDQQNAQEVNKIKWYEAQTKREFNEGQLELIKKRNELEAAQLLDNTPANDEIVDDKY